PPPPAALAPYFTNLDGPVFALVNLPEVTKGALFARYSRSPKSLRRLFLDEFADRALAAPPADEVGTQRAEDLYQRIFVEYGDDSVAQLGAAHLACEQSSQILAKVLEWGRLAAYLEQSTRYVPYDDRPGGSWRYLVPPEVERAGLAERFRGVADRAFETYARWLPRMQEFYADAYPKSADDSDFVYRMSIRAKACDALRGLLPAATRSNVGIFATGQAYEQLLLRMRAHPLDEVRAYADMMLAELRKVIPAFLRRVDVPERGGEWSRYVATTRERTREAAATVSVTAAEPRPDVTLTDFDAEGEIKVVAAALYPATGVPDDQLLEVARAMSPDERARVLAAYVGDRRNRRHRPGRAFERTSYRFDVLCDYGAFRDLQRHRMLTIEWQDLTIDHGYDMPRDVAEAGATRDWNRTMRESADLWSELRAAVIGDDAAQYAVAMAYRIRFAMQMNAREAMHLIELRSSPQGHPTYRRIAHEMHRLIAEEAGHRVIADAMRFIDRSDVDLERLEAERRSEARRRAAER
ncbi:MAG TPA: FAD-dependent thymidylate synthase, partial [Actinomycetota bacterium]|nr:FAD-dependent thymidylate synthase [Actinomycetota bacterium]